MLAANAGLRRTVFLRPLARRAAARHPRRAKRGVKEKLGSSRVGRNSLSTVTVALTGLAG